MKMCPFCDTENEDSAKECIICGTELPDTATASTAPSLSISGGATSAVGGGYTVVITNIGSNKIAVIKEIKEFLNCGLAEAKAKCEGLVVAQGMEQGEAGRLMSRIQSAGASAQVCEDDKVQVHVSATKETVTVTNNKPALIVAIALGTIAIISILLAIMV